MGKINWGKVLVGGLVAGVVLNAVDFVLYGVVLMADMSAAMQALGKPATMSGATQAYYVGFDFVVGIYLVWLYAAIRPRFGAGVKTAIIAGVAGWFSGALMYALADAPMGLMPMKLYVTPVAAGLVYVPIATVAGAWLYKEG